MAITESNLNEFNVKMKALIEAYNKEKSFAEKIGMPSIGAINDKIFKKEVAELQAFYKVNPEILAEEIYKELEEKLEKPPYGMAEKYLGESSGKPYVWNPITKKYDFINQNGVVSISYPPEKLKASGIVGAHINVVPYYDYENVASIEPVIKVEEEMKITKKEEGVEVPLYQIWR